MGGTLGQYSRLVGVNEVKEAYTNNSTKPFGIPNVLVLNRDKNIEKHTGYQITYASETCAKNTVQKVAI